MALDAKNCETAAHHDGAIREPTHQGRRILPEEQPPAQAWTENEEALPSSPGENRRLLPSAPAKEKSRVYAGVTLAVHPPGKYTKCPQFSKAQKTKPKTKFQKIEEKFCSLSPAHQKLISFLRPPYFIFTMILIMACVHVSASEEVCNLLLWSPCLVGSEPWRLVTYGFVHGDNTHLTMNVLVGLAVGWNLEREQSWWRVMVVWFGGVVCGALGTAALQPAVQVVGASAGVYALLTSHLSNVCLRYGHISLWWFRLLSVAVLGTSDLCWWMVRPPSQSVAWSAHALGASVGLLLGFIAYTGENINKISVSICRVISVIILVSAVTGLLYGCWGSCRVDIDKR